MAEIRDIEDKNRVLSKFSTIEIVNIDRNVVNTDIAAVAARCRIVQPRGARIPPFVRQPPLRMKSWRSLTVSPCRFQTSKERFRQRPCSSIGERSASYGAKRAPVHQNWRFDYEEDDHRSRRDFRDPRARRLRQRLKLRLIEPTATRPVDEQQHSVAVQRARHGDGHIVEHDRQRHEHDAGLARQPEREAEQPGLILDLPVTVSIARSETR
jgi:hypothetical protein